MSFSEYDVDRRTKKGNFLRQIDLLINWSELEAEINQFYIPKTDAVGRPAYSGLLLFKMLLVGVWYGGLSDEAVEDMSNSNLHVMRFLKLKLEDNVPDHSVLSRFRTTLTTQKAWDALLNQVNAQLFNLGALIEDGYHVDASITHAQRKPKAKPIYEVVVDRSESDDGSVAKKEMTIIAVQEPSVDAEARWTKKSGQYHYGYKQHTVVNQVGLVKGVVTTPANTHDSTPFVELIKKSNLMKGNRVCADKAYTSNKHTEFLTKHGLKSGIQYKAKKGLPLTKRQKDRNKLITKIRFVVERTFGGQALWFKGKNLRYAGLEKAHGWHTLLAMAYNLKRLPTIFVKNLKTVAWLLYIQKMEN